MFKRRLLTLASLLACLAVPAVGSAQPAREADVRGWTDDLRFLVREVERIHLRAHEEAHPDSWNAWDDLGGAWHKAENLERARTAYEKSVALNPGNANGVSSLEEIARALAARPR